MSALPANRSADGVNTRPGAPVQLPASDTLGWQDLIVREYREPASAELRTTAHAPFLTLGLLTHGLVDLKMRPVSGAWHGKVCQQHSFFLQPCFLQPYDFRWQSAGSAALEGMYIYLPQHIVFRAIEELTERDPTRCTFTEQVGFHDPVLLQLGLALQQELRAPTAVGPLYAQTAAQFLAVHLIRHYATPDLRVDAPKGGLTPAQIRRVTDFVAEHLADDLSLPQLAAHVHVSTYHFTRLFRQSTGESPHQFVLRQRLARAQLLLQTTDTPIVDVALLSGFANQSYLSTVFKQRLGITPSAYRRCMR